MICFCFAIFAVCSHVLLDQFYCSFVIVLVVVVVVVSSLIKRTLLKVRVLLFLNVDIIQEHLGTD